MSRPCSIRETSSWRSSTALQRSITTNSARISTAMSIPLRGAGTIGRNGLIDTSVAIDLRRIERERLPELVAVSALTVAELCIGRCAARHDFERMRREQQLREVWTKVRHLAFDLGCARAYGPIYGAVAGIGRKPRGSRSVDLMIAATALAHDLPLYTKNARDLRGLESLIEIVDVGNEAGT
jgi:predicted nucleic acid-binding protein